MKRKETELRLKAIEKEIPLLKDFVGKSQKKLSELENERIRLVTSLMTKNESIGVSDHAVLRYLERKFKLDIASIREEILTPDRRAAIKAGATKIKTEYVDFVVKDNTIVTSI